ncbi:MAG TPA: hypothetical protein VH143_26650 [Kofleriaceae bacterium]|jgi:hypothetical protein|nr:hypothetical protein [Kofleriaceae bacterium]
MKGLIVAAMLVLAHTARADCICRLFDHLLDRPDGEAWLHYELTGLDRIDLDNRVQREVLAGFRLGGIIGNSHVAYHAELDLFAGAVVQRGGFAYDVALYPLGIATRLGDTGVLALGTGVVAVGAERWLDDGVGLPLQATLEAGGGVRVLARARVALLAGTHDDAAPSLQRAIGQELDAMAGVRFGHAYDAEGFPVGEGYFVAAAYKEFLGARYVGVTFGYSIDASTKRRQVPR